MVRVVLHVNFWLSPLSISSFLAMRSLFFHTITAFNLSAYPLIFCALLWPVYLYHLDHWEEFRVEMFQLLSFSSTISSIIFASTSVTIIVNIFVVIGETLFIIHCMHPPHATLMKSPEV